MYLKVEASEYLCAEILSFICATDIPWDKNFSFQYLSWDTAYFMYSGFYCHCYDLASQDLLNSI